MTKPFEYPDMSLGICMMDCSPGVLSGDRYSVDIRLAAGSDVHVTNQTFTKVHPARCGVGGAMEQRLVVGEGAFLHYDVEPTMLFKDSKFHSVIDIELEADSHFIFHDILCPGRTSRGELFQFEEYSNRINVRRMGELIYANRMLVHPHRMPANEVGLWGEHTHFGTLLLFSSHVNERILEEVRHQIDELGWMERMEVGASLTYKDGIAISGLASHAWQLQMMFRQLAQWFRKAVKNKDM